MAGGAAGGPRLGTGGDGRIPGGTWEQLPVLVWNEKPSEMPARAVRMAQTQRVGTRELRTGCLSDTQPLAVKRAAPHPHPHPHPRRRCAAGSSGEAKARAGVFMAALFEMAKKRRNPGRLWAGEG